MGPVSDNGFLIRHHAQTNSGAHLHYHNNDADHTIEQVYMAIYFHSYTRVNVAGVPLCLVKMQPGT